MSGNDAWSPDQPSGTEVFEQGDEAFDDDSRLDPDLLEAVGLDPALDRSLQVDDRELEEAAAELDDPEELVILEGGIDDPDGVGEPTQRTRTRLRGEPGWDLDAPLARSTDTDADVDEE